MCSTSRQVEAILQRLDAAGQTGLLVALNGTADWSPWGPATRFGPRLAGVPLLELRQLGIRRILPCSPATARPWPSRWHRQLETEQTANLLEALHAELLPQQKAELVAEWQKSDKVAMVGDGINDAPALAGAHVGIAMQKGADIARLTADVALLEDDIARVADAKAAANAVMELIAANYRLTVGLNTGILSAAALGLLSPIATVVLHNGTTIGILLNALRRRSRG